MDIALLGGTGDIGEGLALRWAADTDHRVIIGSRDADRAREKADEYQVELASRGIERDIGAGENVDAAAGADVVVLAVPPYHVRSVVEAIADVVGDAVIINPAVGISRDETGFNYDQPSVGSVTELVAEAAPEESQVVGAYHNLPAARLADLDDDLGMDTPIVGEEEAKNVVAALTAEIDGMGTLDAGPLENSAAIESLTPLLLTLKQYNEELHDVAVQFS